MKTMMVKLQRPMVPPDAAWLIYDKNRQFNEFIAVNDIPSSVTAAMRNDLKGYFEATRSDEGRWIFGKRVKATW